MPLDAKLDERGYPPEAHAKVDEFLQYIETDPESEVSQTFYEQIYNPEQLVNHTTQAPYPTDEAKLRRAVELYLFDKVEVDLGVAVSWDESALDGKCPALHIFDCKRHRMGKRNRNRIPERVRMR